ncbi:MAG TPA: SCO family protein [Pseudolabrys sp.]|nr:SCO family protein [Pseudolabrys sp.]
MKRLAFILFTMIAASTCAHAGFSRSELGKVAATPVADAQLPLATIFADENGKPLTLGRAVGTRPAVLIFADYTCTNLCGPILAFAAGGLEKTKLTPGRDFRLVVIGLDPKDSLAEAQAMKASRLAGDPALAQASVFLTGSADSIRKVTAAAGYRYAYDSEHDQFAHPAVAYVVSAQGRITRMLSGLGLTGSDLRLALVDAGDGRVGSFADNLRLLCYGFDPKLGIYTETITRWLTVACIATVAALAGTILLLGFKTRRSTAS